MSELTAEQIKAIDLLLVLPTLGAVAKEVGVDPRTLYRWMRTPLFSSELRAAQRLSIRQNIRGITAMAATAMKTLVDLMVYSSDHKVRFDSANAALERLFDADLALSADEDVDEEEVS